MGVVVDAELAGHGEQQRVGGCDRLVLLELLDQRIRLGSVGAAEDRLGLRVDEPDLVGVLVLAAEVRLVPVIDEGENAPAYRNPRLTLIASLLPRVARNAAAGARPLLTRPPVAPAGSGLRHPPDDGSGPNGMRNLGNLVHDLEKMRKLVGGCTGADFD